MMRPTGRLVFYISLTLVLSAIPAPSQWGQHGSPHLPPHRDSHAAKDQDEAAAEQSLWDSIKESSDSREFKAFLAKSPGGDSATRRALACGRCSPQMRITSRSPKRGPA